MKLLENAHNMKILFFIFRYDTFEMLRENLDTVLQDLLEFKDHETIPCTYPGPNLNLDDNFLKNLKVCNWSDTVTYNHHLDTAKTQLKENHNNSAVADHRATAAEKREIVNRIRRYLDKKSRMMMKPLSKMKHKFRRYMTHNYKKKKERPKRYASEYLGEPINVITRRKFTIKSKEIRYGRKLLSSTKKVRLNVATDKREVKEDCKDKEDPARGDAALKARFLFKSCMNYEILEKRGHQPLLDLLDLLGGWPILNPKWNDSGFDWLELMAKLRLYNNDILISEWVGPDIKNSDEFVIQFDQTSLGNILCFIIFLISYNSN